MGKRRKCAKGFFFRWVITQSSSKGVQFLYKETGSWEKSAGLEILFFALSRLSFFGPLTAVNEWDGNRLKILRLHRRLP